MAVGTRPPMAYKIAGYVLPNPLRCSDDVTRLRQGDLPTMSDADLIAEYEAVSRAFSECHGTRACIAVTDARGFILADSWLLERRNAVSAEIHERRSRSRR